MANHQDRAEANAAHDSVLACYPIRARTIGLVPGLSG